MEGDRLPTTVQKATVRRANPPKKGGLMGKIQELQERYSQAQREMEKNRRKGK